MSKEKDVTTAWVQCSHSNEARCCFACFTLVVIDELTRSMRSGVLGRILQKASREDQQALLNEVKATADAFVGVADAIDEADEADGGPVSPLD